MCVTAAGACRAVAPLTVVCFVHRTQYMNAIVARIDKRARMHNIVVLPHNFFSYMWSNGIASIDSWVARLDVDLLRAEPVFFLVHMGNVANLLHWIGVHAIVQRRRVVAYDSLPYDNTVVCNVRSASSAQHCAHCIDATAQRVRDFFVRRIALAVAAWRARVAAHHAAAQLPPWLRGGDEWAVDGSGACGKQNDATECGVYALGAADDIAHGRAPSVTPDTVVERRARFGGMLLE